MTTEKLSKEKVMREARAEVEDDLVKEMKADVKKKLRELHSAKKVVKNIEREIEDLELKINDELG